MKKTLSFLALFLSLLILGLAANRPAASAGSLNVSLEDHASGFSGAVDISTHDSNRLFIVERDGRIRIVQPLGGVIPTPFLDIDGRVRSVGFEQGLLGLAFHPNYADNGYFYVYYTREVAGSTGADGDIVVSRFSVTGDPNVADPNSEVILLVIDHPDAFSNHNGGGLEFGPDGYLYIATGDGGSGGDPWDHGQMTEVLLGKLLRIDVDADNRAAGPPDNCSISGANYLVPEDNPFVDGTGGDCDEIWAWGLRNPWRFAFDSLNGNMFIGDVGQNAWEEIDFQPASSPGGENYGWDCYEGNVPYSDGSPIVPCGPENNYVFPIAVHNHSLHCSVTGGEVYRGALFPELYGHYLFTDWCSGHFWSLVPAGGNSWTKTFLGDLGGNFTSLGTRKDGEVFVTDGSKVYHIVEDTSVTATPSPTNPPTSTATATATVPSPTPSASPTATASPSPTITPGGPTLTPTPTPPFQLNLPLILKEP